MLAETSGTVLDPEPLLLLRHYREPTRAAPRTLTALPGGSVSRRRGRGLETDEIRLFYEGDDVRHIDRNTTARTGIPHVRTFRDERLQTVLLVADFRPSMLWGTRRAFRSIAAAEALCLIGWRAVDGGGRVGLMAFGCTEPIFVPARGRERGMIAVIGGLVAAHRAALDGVEGIGSDRTRREPDLETPLAVAAKLAPKGGSVVVATALDHPGPGFGTVARAVDHRSPLTVLLVRDAFEQAAPPGAYPFVAEADAVAWGTVAPGGSDHRAGFLTGLGLQVIEVDAAAGPEATSANLLGPHGWHR